MTGKQILAYIAGAIVLYSILGIIFLAVFFGGRGIVGAILGLVINIILAFGLILEKSWARWILLARCGFGAIFTSVSFFSALPQAGVSQFSILGLWLLFGIVFSVSLALFLLLSKRINEVFNPPSGF